MGRKLERHFRDRPLTPAEAASDADVREKIRQEYPPGNPAITGPVPLVNRPSSFSELLKSAIRESGKSVDEIAAGAGVATELVAQFIAGERDIHVVTAEKLARAVGLKLRCAS